MSTRQLLQPALHYSRICVESKSGAESSPLVVQDPHVHLKNLKPSPVASPLVDACIECGFCESNCPSRDVTLTPRQRITSFREMSRLEGMDSRTAEEEERCAIHTLLQRAGPWFCLRNSGKGDELRLGLRRS